MGRSKIGEKAIGFAARILKLDKELKAVGVEHSLRNQLVRSSTSIGANIQEALGADTRRDFAARMTIARKEAREALYWLTLFEKSELVSGNPVTELIDEAEQIVRMLSAIVVTARRNDKRSRSVVGS